MVLVSPLPRRQVNTRLWRNVVYHHQKAPIPKNGQKQVSKPHLRLILVLEDQYKKAKNKNKKQ